MQTVRPFLLILLFTLFACEPVPEAEPVLYTCQLPMPELGKNHPKAAELQAFLDGKVRQGLPGAIILIKNGEGIWMGAAGKADLAHNILMKSCHQSRIASLTKNFTAVTVMKLAETGKLNIDQKISVFLPASLIAKLPNADRATIRQLMNHSSGIFDYDTSTAFNLDALNQPGKAWTKEEELAYAYDHEAAFAPGEKFQYSNTGFILLGLIIEQVTGKAAQQVMKETIFDPLAMSSTVFPQNYAPPASIIRGYDNRHGDGKLVDMTDFKLGYYTEGGIISTVYDLFVYQQALYEGALLSPMSLEEMKKRITIDQPYAQQTQAGLGMFFWQSPRGEAYCNEGGQYGYRAFMAYFPQQRVSYILLTNNSLVGNDELLLSMNDEITRIIL